MGKNLKISAHHNAAGNQSQRRFSYSYILNLSFLALPVLLGLLPLVTIFIIAISGDSQSLQHLWRFIIPKSTSITLSLLLIVAVLSASIGTMSAWLVTFFDFPGRKILTWALVMPLAIPPYIAAYHFSEFLSYTGPIQELIRYIGGYQSLREYWFPEAHSLWGAGILLTSVLFPYNYLAVLGVFRLQGGEYVAAARSLDAPVFEVFWRILLPLVWPAIMVGTTWVLMECLNDVGAVEYLGVKTLTLSIYSIWLNQGDMAGAAQLSLIIFAFLMVLISLEYFASRLRKKHFTSMQHSARTKQPLIARRKLTNPFMRFLPTLACVLPLLPGFGISLYMLIKFAIRRYELILDITLWQVAFNSLLLGVIAAFVSVLIALMLVYIRRSQKPSPQLNFVLRLATSGYAIPGTIVALGLFIPLARLDNFIDERFQAVFGISTGLMISGSIAILIYAYAIRFLAIAEGNTRAGLTKISTNLESSARVLGMTKQQAILKITLPQLKPVLMIAGLMVFIESIKELSATLFLRPIGFHSLSTYIYDLASQARVGETAFPSLLIIMFGAISAAVMLHKIMNSKGQ